MSTSPNPGAMSFLDYTDDAELAQAPDPGAIGDSRPDFYAAKHVQAETTPSDETWKEWLIPANDTQGHSVRVQCRVQPGLERQLQFAMSAGFPYRSTSDVVRHAIVRHLQWLTTQNPEMRSVVAQVDAITEVVKDDALMQEQQEVLARLQQQVEVSVSRNDISNARRVLAKAMACIEAMPPGGWRDKYREQFQRQFGGYLQATPATPTTVPVPPTKYGLQ